MRRVLETLVVVLIVLAVLIVGIVIFTVQTSLSADQVRQWFDATGGVLSAVAAVVVALLGFRQQRLQAEDALRTSLNQIRLASDENARSTRIKAYTSVMDIVYSPNPEEESIRYVSRELSLYGSHKVLKGWTDWRAAFTRRAEAKPGGSPSIKHLDLQLHLARQRVVDALRAELAPD